MALTEVLRMTKPKLVLLAVLLIGLYPRYYNYGCVNGVCTKIACTCGFQPANFFTIFILSFVASGVIVEVFKWLVKLSK
ncbi:MAG: hypothetical protein NTY48_00740 [Candidatus Diapherotrites archaeon]|nr:hypothetical protein [Candidatus Diapherotrites archaeon]